MKVSYCSFLKSKAGCVMMVVYFMKLPVLSHTAPFQIFLSPVFLGSQIIHTLRLSSHTPSDIEPLYHLLYVYYLFVYRGIPPKKFDVMILAYIEAGKLKCFASQSSLFHLQKKLTGETFPILSRTMCVLICIIPPWNHINQIFFGCIQVIMKK